MSAASQQPTAPRGVVGRSSRGLFGVAVGFLAGVLVAALLVPDADEVITRSDDAHVASRLPDGRQREAGSTEIDLDGGDAGELGSGANGGTGASEAGDPGGAGGAGSASPGDAGTESAGGTRHPGGATAPGVSATEVTIGVGLPDIGVIAALGPGYDQGNPRDHVEAVLAHLREEGRLPVAGRDIRPVYRTYDILSEPAQRAVCESFARDVTVFAVVALHNFGPGNQCVAEEFDIPVITTDGQSDALYASTPNMISLQMSIERLMRNFVEWAHRRGDLTGKRIGVYYSSDPDAARVVRQSIIGPLRERGHTIAAEVQTSEPATGGPTDSVAVQRFRSSGVDVAILVVSAVAKTNFFNQAQLQNYRPTYLENDIGFSTTTTATGTYPANHFDGTRGFSGMRFGEAAAGLPEPAEAQWCMGAIRSRTGRPIDPQRNEGEYIAANQACDELQVVLTALEHAGPELTRERFFAGLHSIQGRPTGIHGDISFQPGRHHGVATWRELVWRAGCRCWVAEGSFQPLWLR
jgi:hypothetical protein